MHIVFHFVPRNDKAGAVGAENRSCRVLKVKIEIISESSDDFLRIVARFIPGKAERQSSASFRVGDHIPLVVPHRGNRRGPGEQSHCAVLLRCGKFTLHPVEVRHRASEILGRDFQTECVVRLQEHTSRLTESLADGPVSRLAEIAALGMFQVGASRDQRDLHVGDLGTGQDPAEAFFFKMR